LCELKTAAKNGNAQNGRRSFMSSHPPAPGADRHQDILSALQAQDVARAIALACVALADGDERSLYLNLRAFEHERAGRDALALADLKRAHSLDPDDMQALNALGLAYARNNQFEDARAAFSQVVARLPEFAPAHFNMGWASEEIGELDDARESWKQAHAIDPANPEPLARLALLEARLGANGEAKLWAAKALTLMPAHPGARLAAARADLQEDNLVVAGETSRALAHDPRTPPFERTEALGILGDVLDSQNRTAEAFAAWRARNTAVQTQNAARYARPAGETMPEYLHRLTNYFGRIASWPPSPVAIDAPCAQHVFLIGFPRSGTTLLEEALAQHSDVITTQERDGLADGVREFMNANTDIARLAALGENDAEQYRRLYWQRLRGYGLEPAGKTVIDKQPYNTINLPLIARLFPDARIVFSLRDPRDVVLSCFRRRFRMNASNYELLTLEGAAALYDAIMRLAALYRARLPLTLVEVRHESLTTDFASEMERVADFIGLPNSGALREFMPRQAARAIVTPTAAQLAKGLRNDTGGQWRRYREELAPVLPRLQPWVSRFGYSDI
jgi:tetratricopeptide (TPR) repeat protein